MALFTSCAKPFLLLQAASAGETEYATLFMAGQEASMLRSTLESLEHIQPPTIGIVDNAFAVGLCNDSIKANFKVYRSALSLDTRQSTTRSIYCYVEEGA